MGFLPYLQENRKNQPSLAHCCALLNADRTPPPRPWRYRSPMTRDNPEHDPAPTGHAARTDAAASADRLDVAGLTWQALLGHWVAFARSATALPTDEAGERLRAAVPDLIMLQAVWFALQHLHELPDPAERALGFDRAQILIDRHEAALRDRWAHATLPDAVAELCRDARQALAAVATDTPKP